MGDIVKIIDELINKYKKTQNSTRGVLTEECKAIINYIIVTSDMYNSNKSLKDPKREILDLNKINSILFMLQLCYAEKYGKLVFEDEFYAGIYGPTIERIYYEYNRSYGNDFHLSIIPTNSVVSDEVKEILDCVLEYTRQLTTTKLRDMVQQNELWYSVFDPKKKEDCHRNIISNGKILDYCQNYDEHKSNEKRLTKKC